MTTKHNRSLIYPSLMRNLSLFDEDFLEGFFSSTKRNQMGISEDEKHVYVEVSAPGLNKDDIEITVDKGTLWVKGEHQEKEENKKKKHYFKLNRSFSYQVTIPGNVDETAQPEAGYKDGILLITFSKVKEAEPKRITVTEG